MADDEKPKNQQRMFAQAVEQAQKQRMVRRKNVIVFSGLLAAVAGICILLVVQARGGIA